MPIRMLFQIGGRDQIGRMMIFNDLFGLFFIVFSSLQRNYKLNMEVLWLTVLQSMFCKNAEPMRVIKNRQLWGNWRQRGYEKDNAIVTIATIVVCP